MTGRTSMGRLITLAAAIASLLCAAPALAQTQPPAKLPPGPGLVLVNSYCVSCHPVSMITTQRKKAADWASTVQKMADRGSEASPEELNVIIDYLAKALPLETPAATTKTNQRGGLRWIADL